MFNVGGGELLVIMLIALIVLGPQRLPDAARQVGKVMGDLRRLSSGFQNEMKTAFTEADDPTRVSARRNVLAKEAPVVADDEPYEDLVVEQVDDLVDAPDDDQQQHAEVEAESKVESDVGDAVAAVSNHPVATPKNAPPARAKTTSTTAEKATAAEKAATANASPATKAAAAEKASPAPPAEPVSGFDEAVPEAPPPRSTS